MTPADHRHPEVVATVAKVQRPEVKCHACGAIVTVLLSNARPMRHRTPAGPMCEDDSLYWAVVSEWNAEGRR